ncbi:MAG: SOS response-associated peptidase [Ilumatobacteraceae bacterium]
MCGRFVSTSSAADVGLAFEALVSAVDVAPNFNIAPTATIYGVVHSGNQRMVENFSWGLVPLWAKDRSRASSLINARSETVAEKPSFRNLLKRHRCVVPLAGYYEWMSVEVPGVSKVIKQPYYFTPNQSTLFAVAGLWTTWHQPGSPQDAPVLHSCVLITTDANKTVAAVHNRMPVLLDEDGIDQWISGDEQAPLHLLRPAADNFLSAVKVGTAVNSTRNRGPQLIEEVDRESGDSPESETLF